MKNKRSIISLICGILGMIIVGALLILMDNFAANYPISEGFDVENYNFATTLMIISFINICFPLISIVFGVLSIFKDGSRILGIIGLIVGIISLIIVIFGVVLFVELRESITIVVAPS